jgi:16S rRNA (cytosine967-C5)-methyltransferase
VSNRDAYANLTLPALLRDRSLVGRDAAFATELTYGTLRARGTYDAVVAAVSSRPVDAVDGSVLDALRLGVHQLLGMRVPAHASVSSTVDLVLATDARRSAGFVNAVLRRVAERDRDGWLAQLAPAYAVDPVGHLALVHAHPRWVVEAFLDALGGDLAETAAALAADNVAPGVHLAARPGLLTRDELLDEAGAGAEPGRWSPYAVYLDSGDPGALPAIRTGHAGVQDEGSQLAALALAAAPMVGRDDRWLDMCAGPGGKAALLAGFAEERGAVLLAVDVAPHRAALARSVLANRRCASVVVADGTRPAWPAATFDRVLLDAPCTGLGALRRRPEARWRKDASDVDRLSHLQGRLLDKALDAVRPGGVVGYVTCSPHQAETRDVIAGVLEGRRDVDHEPTDLPGAGKLGAKTGLGTQLWPHRQGTDAIFVALLRKSDAVVP